jgi:ribosome-binding protein aMBF1 (putative translation factor)
MSAPRAHFPYRELALARKGSSEYREGYSEARRGCLIGQAVRERRMTLGLSVAELAGEVRMTQRSLLRLEAGGIVPTITLLERIAAALDADLTVIIDPRNA